MGAPSCGPAGPYGDTRARAVAAGFGRDSPLVLTHHSALAVWGIPVQGVDDRVHLT